MNRVAFKQSKEDIHDIYIVDKYNNEVRLSIQGKERALELKAHQFYCYDFDIYLYEPLIVGNTEKYIAKVSGIEQEEALTKLQLGDFISRQIEMHAPAAGKPKAKKH
ncbi:hypothetical protein L3Q72_21950 [Vibrio sp. JC009]|uniref:hypothetical protein n=1 Tax=Vibrio sp. JC009 TaxID=2912314 RepID=UPI0023AFE1C8|nr:hypothetical protein [Vibrio sp. JC009]WED23899.1 hypothetical protein L3Q72_21950 [Vibrio sp. JC009]